MENTRSKTYPDKSMFISTQGLFAPSCCSVDDEVSEVLIELRIDLIGTSNTTHH